MSGDWAKVILGWGNWLVMSKAQRQCISLEAAGNEDEREWWDTNWVRSLRLVRESRFALQQSLDCIHTNMGNHRQGTVGQDTASFVLWETPGRNTWSEHVELDQGSNRAGKRNEKPLGWEVGSSDWCGQLLRVWSVQRHDQRAVTIELLKKRFQRSMVEELRTKMEVCFQQGCLGLSASLNPCLPWVSAFNTMSRLRIIMVVHRSLQPYLLVKLRFHLL